MSTQLSTQCSSRNGANRFCEPPTKPLQHPKTATVGSNISVIKPAQLIILYPLPPCKEIVRTKILVITIKNAILQQTGALICYTMLSIVLIPLIKLQSLLQSIQTGDSGASLLILKTEIRLKATAEMDWTVLERVFLLNQASEPIKKTLRVVPST